MVKTYFQLCLAGSALLLSGCQTPAPRAPDYTQYDPAYNKQAAVARAAQPTYNDSQDIEPAAGPAPRASQSSRSSAPTYMMPEDPEAPASQPPARSNAVEADMMRLQERLQRIERAMLRLDRRMQLVERNELNRMSGGSEGSPVANANIGSGNELASLNDVSSSPTGPSQNDFQGQMRAPVYGDGFQPVSTQITSSLQAAPRQNPGYNAQVGVSAGTQMAGLPSLADGPTSNRAIKPAVDVAIWTVRFDSDKVWPDREQLPSSRDVVAMLRDNRNINLFARGSKPNSVEFRDRVKALSRYLSKVTSLESVPIATMSAPHLDNNTIEIFASP